VTQGPLLGAFTTAVPCRGCALCVSFCVSLGLITYPTPLSLFPLPTHSHISNENIRDNGNEDDNDNKNNREEGLVNSCHELSKKEQDEHDVTVHPVWLVLVKVGSNSAQMTGTDIKLTVAAKTCIYN
jgi:hypothetical protein